MADTWIPKTWGGVTSINSNYIWTDGTDIYYSYESDQYVLDKATSTWSPKEWNGLAGFDGDCIWTDSENIYYSNGSSQYVLDKATSTWAEKEWNGLTSYYSSYIWTDSENIYCSGGANMHYVLDKETSTWAEKEWNNLVGFSGDDLWTDSENIYCSNGFAHYVLDKETSTWSQKTWNGLSSLDGRYVWTDGENIYCSSGYSNYVLDKATSTWTATTWDGLTDFSGSGIWTDGTDIYYSVGINQYVLDGGSPENLGKLTRLSSCLCGTYLGLAVDLGENVMVVTPANLRVYRQLHKREHNAEVKRAKAKENTLSTAITRQGQDIAANTQELAEQRSELNGKNDMITIAASDSDDPTDDTQLLTQGTTSSQTQNPIALNKVSMSSIFNYISSKLGGGDMPIKSAVLNGDTLTLTI